MNKTVPSPTNWPEQKPAKKRGGIRVINEGTPYDVPGRLKKWAREIESGKMGRVTDYLLVVRCIKEDEISFEHFLGGTGTPETYMYMARAAEKRTEPSPR